MYFLFLYKYGKCCGRGLYIVVYCMLITSVGFWYGYIATWLVGLSAGLHKNYSTDFH